MPPTSVRRRARLAGGVVCALVLALAGCSESGSRPSSAPASSQSSAEGGDGGVHGGGAASAAPVSLEDLVPGLQAKRPAYVPAVPLVSNEGPQLRVAVGTGENPVGTWLPMNVGLSFEASDLADPRWDPDVSSLDELVASLGRPALRFGGNSVDRRVWWTSTGEPRPDWARVTVTPESLARLGRFVAKTRVSVTLDLPLGHFDPARAADLAVHARAALGESLLAVSFGNEPNGYRLASQPQLVLRGPGWGTAQYVQQARAYEKPVHARVPGLPIAGPGAYDAVWWRAFASAHLPNTVALTQHWYPLWSCPGRVGESAPQSSPLVANLVSPWQHARARTVLGQGVATAAGYGLPLWLEETGPTSCGGTNETSRTHAQALWTVDYVLSAASVGVRRLAMHSSLAPCVGGPPMSVVCRAQDLGRDRALLTGGVGQLALMFVAQVRPGEFVPMTLTDTDPTHAQRVFAYAVKGVGGIDLVVVNLNDPATVGASALTLALPPRMSAKSASVLYGNDLSGHGVTQLERLAALSPEGAATLTLNPGSALLLRIGPG